MAQDAATACPTDAAGALRLPKTTRRPLSRSTAQIRRRPSSKLAPQRSTSRPNAAFEIRPFGSALRPNARTGAPTAAPMSPAETRRFAATGFPLTVVNDDGGRGGSSTGRAAEARFLPGRRGERPAARYADTMDPALVPTKAR